MAADATHTAAKGQGRRAQLMRLTLALTTVYLPQNTRHDLHDWPPDLAATVGWKQAL